MNAFNNRLSVGCPIKPLRRAAIALGEGKYNVYS